MKSIIFSFFLLILISNSYAYDCNQFSGLDKESCIILNSTNENLISNLIYKNSTYPDHNFIKHYNDKILSVIKPNNISTTNTGVIQNTWISILYINPSVFYQDKIYVPKITNYRAELNYTIILPVNYYNSKKSDGRTCQIIYSKNSEKYSMDWLIDGKKYSTGKIAQIVSENYDKVTAKGSIEITTKAENYLWNKYCCRTSGDDCKRYCYECKYKSSTYTTDKLTIEDYVLVENYLHNPSATFTITDKYSDTFKGVITTDNKTTIFLNLNNSFYKEQKYIYSVNFSKSPNNFIYLIATDNNNKISRNLIVSDGNVYVKDNSMCTIESTDFFTKTTTQCKINITKQETVPKKSRVFNPDLIFLLKLLVFVFVLYLIYKCIKNSWKKALIPLTCLIIIPSASAVDDCGISNLASCIPQKMYEYFLNLLNAPLSPLLNLVKNMFESAPSIALFHSIWSIMAYCISLFYGLLFVYSGFLFLFSGHDVIKREMAKEWLKNTVIMIVLVQASFYLYGLFVDLGSIMTSSVMSMIDPHFFMITADNLINIGLEFMFLLLYVIALFFTLMLLTIRYLVVAFGVLFIPLAIFCYFVPPLRSYGKLILNILGMFIFVTFIDAIILLACSMLITIPLFENIKIIVMITCFSMINLLFLILIIHIITKASFEGISGKAVQAGKYIAMIG